MTTIVPSDDKTTSIVSSLFAVEFGPISGLFTEASGFSMDIEEVKSTRVTADGKSVTRFSPGTVKYGTITLKREFTGDKAFFTWHDNMCKGMREYQDGSIVMYDLQGTEVDRWNVLRAWPSKWSVADLDAGGDDVVIEEIELQLEGLERNK
jgi:phage tail-like protein